MARASSRTGLRRGRSPTASGAEPDHVAPRAEHSPTQPRGGVASWGEDLVQTCRWQAALSAQLDLSGQPLLAIALAAVRVVVGQVNPGRQNMCDLRVVAQCDLQLRFAVAEG